VNAPQAKTVMQLKDVTLETKTCPDSRGRREVVPES
jgi:hypothetical protein